MQMSGWIKKIHFPEQFFVDGFCGVLFRLWLYFLKDGVLAECPFLEQTTEHLKKKLLMANYRASIFIHAIPPRFSTSSHPQCFVAALGNYNILQTKFCPKNSHSIQNPVQK